MSRIFSIHESHQTVYPVYLQKCGDFVTQYGGFFLIQKEKYQLFMLQKMDIISSHDEVSR